MSMPTFFFNLAQAGGKEERISEMRETKVDLILSKTKKNDVSSHKNGHTDFIVFSSRAPCRLPFPRAISIYKGKQ